MIWDNEIFLITVIRDVPFFPLMIRARDPLVQPSNMNWLHTRTEFITKNGGLYKAEENAILKTIYSDLRLVLCVFRSLRAVNAV